MPQVEVVVWCPTLHIRRKLWLVVDTSSPDSVFSAADLPLDPHSDFPLDDLITVSIHDVDYRAIERSMLLTFEHDDGRFTTIEHVGYVIDARLGRSRIGRDLLNQWLMVYDAPGANLLFEPAAV